MCTFYHLPSCRPGFRRQCGDRYGGKRTSRLALHVRAPGCQPDAHGDRPTFRITSDPMGWDPDLPSDSAERLVLDRYHRLIEDLNRRINLFARSALDVSFYERHILHALCLRWRRFPAGSTVVDWGSGGGVPGIPLAICFPEVRFVLVEATGKKAAALRLIRSELALPNVEVWNGRAESWDGSHEFAVSRGTAPLETLWRWTRRGLELTDETAPAGTWERGLVCLKGGSIAAEMAQLERSFPELAVTRFDLATLTDREAFRDKHIVHTGGLVGKWSAGAANSPRS